MGVGSLGFRRTGVRVAIMKHPWCAALIWTCLTISSRAQDVTTGLVDSLQFDGSTLDTSISGFAPLTVMGGVTRYVSDRFGVDGKALQFVTPPSDCKSAPPRNSR